MDRGILSRKHLSEVGGILFCPCPPVPNSGVRQFLDYVLPTLTKLTPKVQNFWVWLDFGRLGQRPISQWRHTLFRKHGFLNLSTVVQFSLSATDQPVCCADYKIIDDGMWYILNEQCKTIYGTPTMNEVEGKCPLLVVAHCCYPLCTTKQTGNSISYWHTVSSTNGNHQRSQCFYFSFSNK